MLQPAGLHSKKIKQETSQKNHQKKLQQGKRKNRQQNINNKPSMKATKTKIRAQEVTEIEEVAPPTTCIKARNANVYNLALKTIKQSIKSLQKNKANTQMHVR